MAPQIVDVDPEVQDILKKVVRMVTREHSLTGNQLYDLASHLSRIATHRIVQEQIRQHSQRSDLAG